MVDQLAGIDFILGLQVTLLIMIQLGSIFQIPLCIIFVCARNVMETLTPPDLSLALKSKLSAVSCDIATWHTNYHKPDATATLCKIFQTLYLCLTAQL